METIRVYSNPWSKLKKVFGPTIKFFVRTMFIDFEKLDRFERRNAGG